MSSGRNGAGSARPAEIRCGRVCAEQRARRDPACRAGGAHQSRKEDAEEVAGFRKTALAIMKKAAPELYQILVKAGEAEE